MKYIVLDAETYWAQDYTLSKMTPEEYIRDPRFLDFGWGVMPVGGEPVWLDPFEFSVFAARVDWDDTAIICHNTRFDGAILGWRYGIKPKLWIDTQGVYRALYPQLKSHSLAKLGGHFGFGAKGAEVENTKGLRELSPAHMQRLGEYCKQDCRITEKLFTWGWKQFPPFERAVMDMTLRMFIEPVLEIDTGVLETFLTAHTQEKADALSACGLDRDQLMSAAKFAEALRSVGVEPPTKPSPSNPEKRIFAFAQTDAAMNELAEHDDVRVQALVAARLGNKSTLLETRTRRVIGVASRGPMPIPLNYWGAKTTGRHSGGDKLNMQNWTRGSALRNGLIAPPGHMIVVGDSSNIELRLVMAAAGQMDAIEKIRNKVDLYCDFASDIYGRKITKADVDERFVGKQGMLSLQYMASAARFQEMMRQKGHPISLEEAERVVGVYRPKHSRVKKLWYYCENEVLPAIAAGNTMVPLDVNGWVLTDGLGFSVPGNLGVQYSGLRKTDGRWEYDTALGTVDVYGAKVVENMCIAAGSLVLTDSGWRPIEHVKREDLVHDGVEFVRHHGLIDKSTKHCVTIDGVHMTPDHEVLTNDGWKPASLNPNPYRPAIRCADRLADFAQPKWESSLGVHVSVREHSGEKRSVGNERNETWWHSKLRMFDACVTRSEGAENPRHVRSPRVLGLAFHARQVQVAVASSVEKLRRAWHKSLRTLGKIICSVLGRHGQYVLAGAYAGSPGQRQGVHPHQLSLGYVPRKLYKQTEQFFCADPTRQDTDCRSDAPVGGEAHHTDVAASKGLAPGEDATASAGERQVYDLMDCGPLNRFVVLGESGPFIVHNCQYFARMVVMYQALLVQTQYRVVHSVHDELVCCVREDEAEACAAFMLECLRTPPKWAGSLLPVDGEVGIGKSYGEAK